MDIVVKIMGILDLIAAIVLITNSWNVLQIIGVLILIKGLVSVMS